MRRYAQFRKDNRKITGDVTVNKIKNVILDYIRIFCLNIKEHRENASQIARLSVADLKKTYHGAALGWAWAVVKPVVTVFVYWFAIEIGLKKGGDINGYPYILWLISGIVPWFFMTEAITGGTDCIRRYSYLVTKMKYPVMTIPTFTNLSKFFVNCLLVAATVIIFRICGFKPTIYIIQLPVYMFLMFMFFNAWALFAGMVSAIGKDFSNLVKSLTVAIFWLSAILWDAENVVDNKLLTAFLRLNPVTFLCYGFRNCFVYNEWFFNQPKRLGYFVIEYAFLVLLSFWAYRKLRKEIPDVL